MFKLFTRVALLGALLVPATAHGQEWDLLVSSRGTHSVKRFDGSTGSYVDDFVPAGSGGLNLTQELALSPDGALLVTGRGTPFVLRYDRRTGEFVSPFTTGWTLAEPTKMTVQGDSLLLVSQWGSGSSSVAVFSARTGSYLRQATGNLGQPMQHLLLSSGELLTVAFNMPTIRRIASDGRDLGAFTSGLQMQGPVNLWRHDSGDLLVADWTGGRIERFDGASGAYRGAFITGLASPEGWAVGPDGHLYIAEWTQHRVRRFNRQTGADLGVFASGGGLQNPNSLLFIPRPPDFALTVPERTLDVVAGSSVSTEVSLDKVRGAGYDRPIALTCSGVPIGWTCAFAPATVPANAPLPLQVQLTIQTNAGALSQATLLPELMLLGVLAVGLRPAGHRRRVITVLSMAIAGCSGGATVPMEATVVNIQVNAQGEPHRRAATVRVRATHAASPAILSARP